MAIQLKRIYDDPADRDGVRVLVDRVWPRGLSKEDARLDHWFKSLAPSSELRKWFGHDPQKWAAFKAKYRKELEQEDEDVRQAIDELKRLAGRKRVTLLYGAKDEEHNNAVALKEYLEN